MRSTEEKIREIISDQMGCRVEEVLDDTNVKDDLGADSLDCVEIVMALEGEFDIDIPDSDFEGLSKVKDIIEYVRSKEK